MADNDSASAVKCPFAFNPAWQKPPVRKLIRGVHFADVRPCLAGGALLRSLLGGSLAETPRMDIMGEMFGHQKLLRVINCGCSQVAKYRRSNKARLNQASFTHAPHLR